MKEELYDICWSDNLQMRKMALIVRVKYGKYCGDLSKLNILLCVALILDPHMKIDGMVYGLGIAYGHASVDFIGEMA